MGRTSLGRAGVGKGHFKDEVSSENKYLHFGWGRWCR